MFACVCVHVGNCKCVSLGMIHMCVHFDFYFGIFFFSFVQDCVAADRVLCECVCACVLESVYVHY